MHPLTPLFIGWKVFAGLIALLSIQNLGALVQEFTLRRLAIAGLILLALILVIIAFSAVSWAMTRYAVTENGVFVTRRLISIHRRIAPRERIDSVTIQRPLLPRLLGLAKVRVELAGGGDSGVDIAYVSSARAEEIYRQVQELTASQAPTDAESESAGGLRSRAQDFLFDHVTEGQLLARVPTSRLLRSLLRDVGLWVSMAVSVVFAVAAVAGMIVAETFSIAALVPVFAAVVIGPRLLLSRVEAGWGFVSRSTDTGLRTRRGLLNTRSDSISANRVQQISLVRPFLWSGPGWARVTAETAGAADDGDESGSGLILPVGTREEIDATLTRMLPPMDLELMHRMLDQRPAALTGLRPTSWLLTPIARRREVTVLTDGFLFKRWGLFTRKLEVIPRERIHGVRITEGPLERSRGHCTLVVATAGDGGTSAFTLPSADALRLAETLRTDAAVSRRYRDREHWARPVGDDASDDIPPILAAASPEPISAGDTVEE